ncbi:MAG: hypothetical protein LBT04_03010 [Prevotellaceae bacterium]|jgi:predicted transglutaminase-like cysteine proteinase|nr:hypothetical protein [Prevotellaceae bacterium]
MSWYEIILYLGGGGLIGTFSTKVIDKFILTKKEATDIVSSQVLFLNEINQKLNDTIKQLQDVACYSVNCDDRINGKKVKKN